MDPWSKYKQTCCTLRPRFMREFTQLLNFEVFQETRLCNFKISAGNNVAGIKLNTKANLGMY